MLKPLAKGSCLKYLLIILLILGCSPEEDPVFTYLNFENKKVFFKEIKPLNTDFVILDYIDSIRTSGKYFVLFRGATCLECDEEQGIYLVNINKNTSAIYSKSLKKYTHPGKKINIFSKKIEQDYSLYYGNCIKSKGPALYWIDNYLSNDNVAYFNGGDFQLRYMKDQELKKFNKGKASPDCKMVKPIDREFNPEI